MQEVVPHQEVITFQKSIRRSEPATLAPAEVEQFISALAEKLGDFGQIRKDKTGISGRDLLLCNMKELKGEVIDPWCVYQIDVPYMVAVDNYTSMMRIFRRKGKQGLIDYCKARVNKTALAGTLDILNVHVFHQARPEFQQVLNNIQASKKIDIQFEQ